MKHWILCLLIWSCIAHAANGLPDVYLCVSPNGEKEYKNSGTTAGCKKVMLPGPSENWKFLFANGDKGSIYLDSETISIKNTLHKAWILSDYVEERRAGWRTFHSTKHLALIDCVKRQSGYLQYIEYSEQYGGGAVVYSISHQPSEVRLEDVVPDTVGAETLKHVCAWQRK